MSEQMVTIEIDGRELQAEAGAMLIDVADAAGIHIPRFCYHKKLSTSANCRMCLIEIEKVPRPLPACATPVTAGMKVKSRSALASTAQQGTMEFLLINHPLDCPICDQGGECELQDVAVGYGSDICRYSEGKRVVADKDIGPLVATELTRCIQCTRCVRFGAEIAGIREMGATGRGEHMQIGTYIERSVDSELSGNIIDLCPVGSLTSKPFRFRARAWELVERDAISPHDAVGSNLHLHLRNGEILRVVPKERESINECWLSDRDRFSYQGLYSGERLTRPLIKRNGEWIECAWPEALEAAAQGLKQAAAANGAAALLSPNSTQEEVWLAKRLLAGLGSDQLDFRLRRQDFRPGQPSAPWLGMTLEELEQLDAVLIIGGNPRHDQPLLGHRLRKAAMRGAKITYINPLRFDLNYRAEQWLTTPHGMLDELAAVGKAAGWSEQGIANTPVNELHQAVAEQLKGAQRAAILLGPLALAHPDAALLWGLAAGLASGVEATLGALPEGANGVGAGLLCNPPANGDGPLDTQHSGYLLFNLEPGYDLANPALASQALQQADCVVAINGFRSSALDQLATVQLPLALLGETSGSYVNITGEWQSFSGATAPQGEARPGWKILRVIANLLDLKGFSYESSEAVLQEIRQVIGQREPENRVTVDLYHLEERSGDDDRLWRIGDVPIYASDPLVRHASALQQTVLRREAAIRLNPQQAAQLGLQEGEQATLIQGDAKATLPVVIDPRVANGCVQVQSALRGTEGLAAAFGKAIVERA